MKLDVFISQLRDNLLKHGNADVFVDGGGDVEITEPAIRFVEGRRFFYKPFYLVLVNTEGEQPWGKQHS